MQQHPRVRAPSSRKRRTRARAGAAAAPARGSGARRARRRGAATARIVARRSWTLAAPPRRHACGARRRCGPRAGEPRQQPPGERALGVGVGGEVLARAAAPPRSTAAGTGVDVDLGRPRRPRSGCPSRGSAARSIWPSCSQRVGALVVRRGEDERERLREQREVGVRRAQRRPQREERLASRARRRPRRARGGPRAARRRRRRAAARASRAASSDDGRSATGAQAPPSTPCARTRSMSSRTFSATPSVSSSGSSAAERQQRARPGDRLPDAGQLVELLPRSRATAVAHPRAIASGTPGSRARTISASRSRVRVVDPVVEAAALERVVQLARAVGGQHDQRPARGRDRAELRDRDREVGRGTRAGTPRTRRRRGRSRRSAAPTGRRARAPRAAAAASRNSRAEQLARLGARLGRADRQQLALRSPSRRARGGGRSPRGTAAGSARAPVAPASARATSVLPTPASPSSSSGCSSVEAR